MSKDAATSNAACLWAKPSARGGCQIRYRGPGYIAHRAKIATACDNGMIELFNGSRLDSFVALLEKVGH
ncbi:MAG: hypothetical protein ACOX7H_02200 [Bacillota bacterium]|jgi:hypothetical protein